MATLKQRIIQKLQSGGSLPNILVRSSFMSSPGTILYQQKPLTPAPNLYPIIPQPKRGTTTTGKGSKSGKGDDPMMPSYMQAEDRLRAAVSSQVEKIAASDLTDDEKRSKIATLLMAESRQTSYLNSENAILDKQLDKLGNSNDFNKIAGELLSDDGQFIVYEDISKGYYKLPYNQLNVDQTGGTMDHYVIREGKRIPVTPITADKAVNLAYHDINFIDFMNKLDIPIVPAIRSTTSYDSIVSFLDGLGAQGGIKFNEEDKSYAIIDGRKVSAKSEGSGFSPLSSKVFSMLNNDQKAKIDYYAKLQGQNVTKEEFMNTLVSFTFKLSTSGTTTGEDLGTQSTYSIAVGGGGNPAYQVVEFAPLKTGNESEDELRSKKKLNIDMSSRPLHNVAGKMDKTGKRTSVVPIAQAQYLQNMARDSNVRDHIVTFDGVDVSKVLPNSTIGVYIKKPVGNIVFSYGVADEHGEVNYNVKIQQAVGLSSKIFNSRLKDWRSEFDEQTNNRVKNIVATSDVSEEEAKVLVEKGIKKEYNKFLTKKIKDVILDGDVILSEVKKYNFDEESAKAEVKQIKSILKNKGIVVRPYLHTRYAIAIPDADEDAADKLKGNFYTGIDIQDYNSDEHGFIAAELGVVDPEYIAFVDALVPGVTDASIYAEKNGIDVTPKMIKDLQIISNNMNTYIDFTSPEAYFKQ